MARLPRRAILAALAGVAAAGCARPPQLLALAGVRQPLHVYLIGFPSAAAATFTGALQLCADAYERAHRGAVALKVTNNLVPDDAWFACPPPHPTCPNPPTPYQPVQGVARPATTLFTFTRPPAAQIGQAGLPLWLAKGRTKLDIRFGSGSLGTPRIGSGLPDIILAYDLWQYWLAALGADLGEAFKTLTDDRAGLPTHFERFALFAAPTAGTFTAAFPILRNPMVIVNFGPTQPWDWGHLVSALQALKGKAQLDVRGFLRSDLFPEATALAAAVVGAFGGRIADASARAAPPAFASPAAVAGLRQLAEVAALQGRIQSPGPAELPRAVYPQYLWTPLAGLPRDNGVMRTFSPPARYRFWPLPAGPARRAVPCTYLCATVVSRSGRLARAQDFASFLMNARSQTALAAGGGGLALRSAQAASHAQAAFRWLGADLVNDLVASGDDLVAADLFGGPKTDANAKAYDAAADAFAGALAAVQAPPVRPQRAAQIIASHANG